MRSLIDEHEAFGRAMLADLTGQDRGVTGLVGIVDAQIAEPGRVTRVEAGCGAGRSISVTGSDNVFRDLGVPNPEAELSKADARIAAGDLSPPPAWPTPDEIRKMAITQVAAHYAMAQMAMAEAGPMPLVSSEPWEESDQAYRKRLRGVPRRMLWTWDELDGEDLTKIGQEIGLPRARLVQTQGEPS